MDPGLLLLVILAVGSVVVPIVVGRREMGCGGAIVLISILPALTAGIGLVWYFDANSSRNGMEEAFSGIYLLFPVFAALVEAIGIVVLAITRKVSGQGGSDGPMYGGSSESRE